jgi:hypothetical protein
MFLSVEIIDLILYCLQQIGVMVAVGAETIILIAYLVAMRDSTVDEHEARFSRVVHRSMGVGILLMVLSGLAITILHSMLGEIAIIFAPVFLFKWLLIVGLIGVYITQKGKPFSKYSLEGVLGGTWYALFLVHILAPVTSWVNLLVLYVLFVAGFEVLWVALVMATQKKPKNTVAKATPAPVIKTTKPIPVPVIAKAPEPKPIAPPPAPPAVVLPPPAPIVAKAPEPMPIAPPPPPIVPVVAMPPVVAEHDPHHSLWLPAIHIMPKSKEMLDSNGHVTTSAAVTKHA